MSDTDTTSNSSLPAAVALAFARELRRLAAQVERDLRRHEPVAALSALAAIKPLTGALTDAALSEAMGADSDPASRDPKNTPDEKISHNGYL